MSLAYRRKDLSLGVLSEKYLRSWLVFGFAIWNRERGIGTAGVLSDVAQFRLRNGRLWQTYSRIELKKLHVICAIRLLDSFRQVLLFKLVESL